MLALLHWSREQVTTFLNGCNRLILECSGSAQLLLLSLGIFHFLNFDIVLVNVELIIFLNLVFDRDLTSAAKISPELPMDEV